MGDYLIVGVHSDSEYFLTLYLFIKLQPMSFLSVVTYKIEVFSDILILDLHTNLSVAGDRNI